MAQINPSQQPVRNGPMEVFALLFTEDLLSSWSHFELILLEVVNKGGEAVLDREPELSESESGLGVVMSEIGGANLESGHELLNQLVNAVLDFMVHAVGRGEDILHHRDLLLLPIFPAASLIDLLPSVHLVILKALIGVLL